MAASSLQQLSDATTRLVESVRRSVVCVGGGEAKPRTGLVVGEGEILTTAVSAAPGEPVPVHASGGAVEARVVGLDAASGLALLSAPGVGPAPPFASQPPVVGELTVAVACPVPGSHEARLGMIRCVGGETRLPAGRKVGAYFQTDAARFRGFTGAGVYSADGELLGVTIPVSRHEESFALPAVEIQRILGQIRGGGSVGTGYLGVRTVAAELPAPAEGMSRGLLVTAVEHGSPAQQAGVRVGAFIVRIGPPVTEDVDSLYDALVGLRQGDRLEVVTASADGSLQTAGGPGAERSAHRPLRSIGAGARFARIDRRTRVSPRRG